MKTIEVPFELKDGVWFMWENKAEKGQVTGITFTEDKIRYQLKFYGHPYWADQLTHTTENSNSIFSTKQELLDSL